MTKLKGNPVARLSTPDLRNLAEILERARRYEDLHRLLTLETSERRNAWYETKESIGDVAGFREDVSRAWRLANQESIARRSPNLIGLQCRYALIIASLNSLSLNIPPNLLIALVRHGVWTPSQGLTYGRHNPDPEQRALVLARLSLELSKPMRGYAIQEAVEGAQAIQEESIRARTLTALFPYLSKMEREWALRYALAAARQIRYSNTRAQVLAELVPHLLEPERERVLQEALAAVRMIKRKIMYEDDQAKVLASLAPYLSKLQLHGTMAMVRKIRGEDDQVKAIVKLAPYLPESLLWEGLAMVLKFPLGHGKYEALEILISHLPQKLLLSQVLAVVHKDDWGVLRKAVMALVPFVSVKLPSWALVYVASFWEELPFLPKEKAGLAIRLAEAGYYKEAVGIAMTMWREGWSEAMVGLVSCLPQVEREQVLQEVLKTESQTYEGWKRQVAMFVNLAPYLPEPERKRVLQEALAVVVPILDASEQAQTLAGLTPNLPKPLLREALAAVREIWDESVRAQSLTELARYLPESLLQETLVMVQAIKGYFSRNKVLTALIPQMPARLLLRQVMKIIYEEDHGVLASTVMAFAPYLSTKLLSITLYLITGAIDSTRLLEERIRLATRLAELDYCKEAVAITMTMAGKSRIRATVGLIHCLSHLEREQVLHDALKIARESDNPQAQASILVSLAPHLPEPEREQVLLKAVGAMHKIIYDDGNLARTLAELAPHLSESLLSETRELFWKIWMSDQFWALGQREVLEELAPHLSLLLAGTLSLVNDVERARMIENERARTEILTRLAPLLAKLPCEHLNSLWQTTLPILANRTRKDLLADLHAFEPIIAALGGVEAVTETFRAIQDVGQWWPQSVWNSKFGVRSFKF